MSTNLGKLYVVATPIGNLADLSHRAVDVLSHVDLIAAEDTRHIRILMQHYGITNKLIAFHQHNEKKCAPELVEKLRQGATIALVSDAGTPLLSDPGMPLVKLAKQAGVAVLPVPGACALIAALSVSGLPVSRFIFEGFPPRTAAARKTFYRDRLDCPSCWVFYESSHRILDSIKDLAAILPGERYIVIAREITKLYETVVKTNLAQAVTLLEQDENMRRGEFVVIVDAAETVDSEQILTDDQAKLLRILLTECSLKSAVAMATEITGVRKKVIYREALRLSETIDQAGGTSA